ncbi:MAG: hypothetical protein K0U98_08510 [Deltaproteobacteria bacterium]|nr:hypothetical protein [Deltaproteobacteria bacterium]
MKKLTYWILSAAVIVGLGLGLSTTVHADEEMTEVTEVAVEAAPVIIQLVVEPFSAVSKPDNPQSFYICGDGVCSRGGPVGETCANCPADCGSCYPTC